MEPNFTKRLSIVITVRLRGCLRRFLCRRAILAGDLSFGCERSRWETGGGVEESAIGEGAIGDAGSAFSVACARNDGFSAAGAVAGAKTGVAGGDGGAPMMFGGDCAVILASISAS